METSDDPLKVVCRHRLPEFIAEHNIGEKEVMLFDRIALERHDYTVTKAERLQNAKHWILRLNADGPQKPLDSDQNLPLHQNNASKCKMLTWRKRGNLLYRYFQKTNKDKDKINNLKEKKTSITMSIERLDGGITESHGETRWQHLNLQHRSGKTHNGRRFGSHGSPHHLKNGGEFQKIDACVDRTPTHKTHLCSTVSSQRAPNN